MTLLRSLTTLLFLITKLYNKTLCSMKQDRALKRLYRRSFTIRRVVSSKKTKSQVLITILARFLLTALTLGISHLVDLRRNRTVLTRTRFDFQSHMEVIGVDFFTRLYRISPTLFAMLCDLLLSHLERKKKGFDGPASTPSVEAMLCVTLRILAGASYLDVGWPYGMARPTTYKVVYETLLALSKVLPRIHSPTDEEECSAEARKFQTFRQSPIYGIIASLDGIAIKIQQPYLQETPDPRKYFNRKGFYALCVQAAVGADYKFSFVSARHAGGTHDSTAFQATKLHDVINEGKLPSWVIIVADDSYTNGRFLLTAYSGLRLPNMKDAFNYYLSSCRITVEQSFGMVVCRFGVFWSAMQFSLAKSTLVIIVACKLNNFIIDNEVGCPSITLAVAEENEVRGEPVVHLQHALHMEQDIQRTRHRSREDSSRRDHIAEQLQILGYVRRRRA